MAKTKKTIKKPVWLKYTEEEVRGIILKIAEKEEDITSEKIGLILRDNYGIPSTRIYGFKIGSVLKEAKKYKNPDIKNLELKNEKIKKHLLKNKGDMVAGRALIITKAKFNKASNYQNR